MFFLTLLLPSRATDSSRIRLGNNYEFNLLVGFQLFLKDRIASL